jgi:hypothetical protein
MEQRRAPSSRLANLLFAQRNLHGQSGLAAWRSSFWTWSARDTAPHRHGAQVQTWLRMAGQHVPAIYGPSGDVKWDDAGPTYSLEAPSPARSIFRKRVMFRHRRHHRSAFRNYVLKTNALASGDRSDSATVNGSIRVCLPGQVSVIEYPHSSKHRRHSCAILDFNSTESPGNWFLR